MSKFKKEVEEAFGPLSEEPAVQGNLSPEEIVRRQLDRTAISRSLGEEIWEANVMMCLSFLPTNKREEIHERLEEYNTKKVDLRRIWCGRRMPSRDGEPEWKFGVDYQKLFEIVVTGFEECGLTWRTKTESVELGKIEAKP
ncbi:hypothetical protein MUP77_04600, partial [Candidatus Bathyarchaeota archaeon]|nr:hypothetical protein [Candidatus Bathyarchaeota archaeon]